MEPSDKGALLLKSWAEENAISSGDVMLRALRKCLDGDDDDAKATYDFLRAMPFDPDAWAKRNNSLRPFTTPPLDGNAHAREVVSTLNPLFDEYHRVYALAFYRSCNALARSIVERSVAGLFPECMPAKGNPNWTQVFEALEALLVDAAPAVAARTTWKTTSNHIHGGRLVASPTNDTAYRNLHEQLRKIVRGLFSAQRKPSNT